MMSGLKGDVGRCASALMSVSRVFAIALWCALALAFGSSVTAQAATDDPHWTIEMPVDAPAKEGDPFVLHVTLRLVGPRVGTVVPTVSTMYSVTAIAPDGTKRPVYDHATAQASMVGSVWRIPTSMWPRQNGEWTFRVVQFVGDAEVVVGEPHASTDKAAESAAVLAASAPQFVNGLRVDPPEPVVGQLTTIVVEMASQPPAVIREVPVNLVDDDGVHPLGTIASPGAGGTATLAWIPQQATEHGLLDALDQTKEIVVLDAPAAPASGNEDSTDTGPSPTDNNGGLDQ